ncbi:STAS domain-containing protein [Acaryochloris sp. CCMEE 5410]|uniref:STAS domain-containing protein n=1 Tax=Acaryochloris sp. CCMEE 5410 TaxID=310037 RepID=UPI0002483FE8|nr:STAS domain-containing protein [Acaryochloris sp. CCMEE 5410]KAI9133609.1 STAS domain-containing protein [Acaryochloris sp. CCMEE 5410]
MSYVVFQPADMIDGISTSELRTEVNDALADGVKTILIDLKDVTFMNSSAIGALVATLKSVRGEGGTLALCSLSDQVHLIFELTKMDRIFDIYGDCREFMQKNSISAS